MDSSSSSDSAEHHNDLKHVRKVVSIYDVHVKADCRIAGAAPTFAHAVPRLDACLGHISLDVSPDQIMPGDIPWDTPEFAVPLAALGALLNHDYNIENTKEQRNELGTALNTPFISGLYHFHQDIDDARDVLIIGADRGQNLSQIEKTIGAERMRFKTWTLIEPNRKVHPALLKTLDDLRIVDFVIVDQTVTQAIRDGTLGDERFDAIFHNMGMHLTSATAVDRVAYQKLVRDYLSHDGIFLGTTVDVHGALQVDLSGTGLLSHTVEVLGSIPPCEQYVEGAFTIRMGGRYFLDPVLSVPQIHEMMSGTGRRVQVIPARYFMRSWRGDPSVSRHEVPRNLRRFSTRPELAMVNVVLIGGRTPVRGLSGLTRLEEQQIRMDPNNAVDYNTGVDKGVVNTMRWKKLDHLHPTVAACFNFHYNHGIPMTDADLLYVRNETCYVAPKLNGVAGKVLVTAGATYLQLATNATFILSPNGVPFKERLALQVEVLAHALSGQRESDAALPISCVPLEQWSTRLQVVVVDVARIGYKTPVPFIERWAVLKRMFQSHTSLEAHLELQEYHCPVDIQGEDHVINDLWNDDHYPRPPPTSQAISMFGYERENLYYDSLGSVTGLVGIQARYDGLVVQPLMAPPGAMRDGAGSARYVKHEWTVDLKSLGLQPRIIECRLGDVDIKVQGDDALVTLKEGAQVVRVRHDKTTENTLGQIRKMYLAITPSELRRFFGVAKWFHENAVMYSKDVMLRLVRAKDYRDELSRLSPRELCLLAGADFGSIVLPRLAMEGGSLADWVRTGWLTLLKDIRQDAMSYIYHNITSMIQGQEKWFKDYGHRLRSMIRLETLEIVSQAVETDHDVILKALEAL